jgi:hypothetical protein
MFVGFFSQIMEDLIDKIIIVYPWIIIVYVASIVAVDYF